MSDGQNAASGLFAGVSHQQAASGGAGGLYGQQVTNCWPHYPQSVDQFAVRKWALELAARLLGSHGDESDAARLKTAKLYADFVLTGAVPSGEGKAP